jgi:hypothetical protein
LQTFQQWIVSLREWLDSTEIDAALEADLLPQLFYLYDVGVTAQDAAAWIANAITRSHLC